MYVCMYMCVCMYICMYVCIYVGMHVRVCVCIYVYYVRVYVSPERPVFISTRVPQIFTDTVQYQPCIYPIIT